ncbi:MAG TPA: MerR family transcriptional regulator [Stellaceae bacterium]|nr:MerR family transcriptional regulator [Stellaceae bacterium]
MGEPEDPTPARSPKSAGAFRTIGEVVEDIDVPAHVLRFWEAKFPQLKPLKRGGGRRYYRPEDIQLLRRIRQCLYQDGYTIRGVQKLLGGGTDVIEQPAGQASLFPVDAAEKQPAKQSAALRPEKPARRARPRPAASAAEIKADVKPMNRAALEEIRRELLEARAQLDHLLLPKIR